MAVCGACVVPCIKGWFVQILDEEDGAGVELSNVNVMSRPDPPACGLKHMQDTVDEICQVRNGLQQRPGFAYGASVTKRTDLYVGAE